MGCHPPTSAPPQPLRRFRVVHEEQLLRAGQLRVWFDGYQTFADEMDELAFAARNTAIAGPMASRGAVVRDDGGHHHDHGLLQEAVTGRVDERHRVVAAVRVAVPALGTLRRRVGAQGSGTCRSPGRRFVRTYLPDPYDQYVGDPRSPDRCTSDRTRTSPAPA